MTDGEAVVAGHHRGWRAVAGRWLHPWFLAATATFVVGAVAGGVAMAAASPDSLATAAEAFGNPDLFPDRLTTWTIFSNNLLALLVVAAGGVSFGAATAFALLFNGLLLGAIVAIALGDTGLVVLAALILPHGVFELPALFLVGGVAYRLTWRLVAYLRGIDDHPATRRELGEAVVLLVVAVALLVVAAFVEANVTPGIGRAVAGSG